MFRTEEFWVLTYAAVVLMGLGGLFFSAL